MDSASDAQMSLLEDVHPPTHAPVQTLDVPMMDHKAAIKSPILVNTPQGKLNLSPTPTVPQAALVKVIHTLCKLKMAHTLCQTLQLAPLLLHLRFQLTTISHCCSIIAFW